MGRQSEYPRHPIEHGASTVDTNLHPSGNFILPQFFEDVKKNIDGNTFFQKNQGANVTEPEKTLVAYHNISADNLRKALASGGLPVPSIAITQKDIPFTNFGDITLVGTKDIIDPERGTDG